MRILSHRDLFSALVTGVTTGVIGWRILLFLDKGLPLGIPPVFLVPLVPFLWVCGVQLGYALATVLPPMGQFGKFAAIGFANAAVDFGVLYFFIAMTGFTDTGHNAIFKTVSFSVAIVHSYFWNKYWAFDAGRKATTGHELASFLAVSLVSLAINVGADSLVVYAGPLGGMTAAAWAGVGAIAGSAASLIFSFVGFRLFVFGKK